MVLMDEPWRITSWRSLTVVVLLLTAFAVVLWTLTEIGWSESITFNLLEQPRTFLSWKPVELSTTGPPAAAVASFLPLSPAEASHTLASTSSAASEAAAAAASTSAAGTDSKVTGTQQPSHSGESTSTVRSSRPSARRKCNFGRLPGMFKDSVWSPFAPPDGCTYRQFIKAGAQASADELQPFGEELLNRSILVLGNELDSKVMEALCARFQSFGSFTKQWLPSSLPGSYQYCSLGPREADFVYGFATQHGVFEKPYHALASSPEIGMSQHIQGNLVQFTKVTEPHLILIRSDSVDLQKLLDDGAFKGFGDQRAPAVVRSWYEGVRKLVSELRRAFPRARLAWGTAPPAFPSEQPWRFLLQDLNQMIRRHARRDRLELLDFGLMMSGKNPVTRGVKQDTSSIEYAWLNMVLNVAADPPAKRR